MAATVPPSIMVHKWTWAGRADFSGGEDRGPADSPHRALYGTRSCPQAVGGMCYATPLRQGATPTAAQLIGRWWRSDTVRQHLWTHSVAEAAPHDGDGDGEGEGEEWGTVRWILFVRGTAGREGMAEHAQFHTRDFVRIVVRTKHPHRRYYVRCEVPFYQCPLADTGLIGAAVQNVWASLAGRGEGRWRWRWTERSVEYVAFVPVAAVIGGGGTSLPHWSAVWPALQLSWWIHRVLGRPAERDDDDDGAYEIHVAAELPGDSSSSSLCGRIIVSGTEVWSCFGDPRWLVAHDTLSPPTQMVGTDLLGPQAWYVHSLGRDAHFRQHQAPQYVMWASTRPAELAPPSWPGSLGAFYAWLDRWANWPRVAAEALLRTAGTPTHCMPDPAPLNLLDPHTFDRAYLVTCTQRRRPRVVPDHAHGGGGGVHLPLPEWLRRREAERGTPRAYLPCPRTYAPSSDVHPHVVWAETYDAPCCFQGAGGQTPTANAAYRYVKSTLHLGGGDRAQGRLPDEWVRWADEAAGGRIRALLEKRARAACRRHLGGTIYECALALLRLAGCAGPGPGFDGIGRLLLAHPLAPSGPLHSWSLAELVGVWSAATGWSASITRVESRPHRPWHFGRVRPALDLAFFVNDAHNAGAARHVFLWQTLDAKRNTRPLTEYQIVEWGGPEANRLSMGRHELGAGALLGAAVRRPWPWVWDHGRHRARWRIGACWPGGKGVRALRIDLHDGRGGWIQVDPPAPWVAGTPLVSAPSPGNLLPAEAVWEPGAWEAWCGDCEEQNGHPFAVSDSISRPSADGTAIIHQTRPRPGPYTYTAVVGRSLLSSSSSSSPSLQASEPPTFLTTRLLPIRSAHPAHAPGLHWFALCWRALRSWAHRCALQHLRAHVGCTAGVTVRAPTPTPTLSHHGWGGREFIFAPIDFDPDPDPGADDLEVTGPEFNGAKEEEDPFPALWSYARRKTMLAAWLADTSHIRVRPDLLGPDLLRTLAGLTEAGMFGVWDRTALDHPGQWVLPDLASAAVVGRMLERTLLTYPQWKDEDCTNTYP